MQTGLYGWFPPTSAIVSFLSREPEVKVAWAGSSRDVRRVRKSDRPNRVFDRSLKAPKVY